MTVAPLTGAWINSNVIEKVASPVMMLLFRGSRDHRGAEACDGEPCEYLVCLHCCPSLRLIILNLLLYTNYSHVLGFVNSFFSLTGPHCAIPPYHGIIPSAVPGSARRGTPATGCRPHSRRSSAGAHDAFSASPARCHPIFSRRDTRRTKQENAI